MDIPFTIVKSGGISDNKRQQVYNENISIMKIHNKKINMLKIYVLKFFQLLKDVLKLLLSEKLKSLLIKIKYNKRIIL